MLSGKAGVCGLDDENRAMLSHSSGIYHIILFPHYWLLAPWIFSVVIKINIIKSNFKNNYYSYLQTEYKHYLFEIYVGQQPISF